MPGCIFITFAVVKDEGKADIEMISVEIVPHEASNKDMNKVEIIRILIAPVFIYETHMGLTEVGIDADG